MDRKMQLESPLDEVHLVWLVLVAILVFLAVAIAALSALSGGPRR